MCLVLDHIVPERDIATPRKMRYILSMTDMFSGYVIAKPTKNTGCHRVISYHHAGMGVAVWLPAGNNF